jgi:hypothetical protein
MRLNTRTAGNFESKGGRSKYGFSMIVTMTRGEGMVFGAGTASWITYSQPLSEVELKEMFSSDTRISMDWANGESGAITYNSDRSATADVGEKNISGNWQIQNGRLCMNWNISDESTGHCN